MAETARRIALRAHNGQVDKAGAPYSVHVEHVAAQMTDEDTKTVAYLHDVLEDTDISEAELREMFPAHIVDAVRLLTKQKGGDYSAYLAALKENLIARAVKIADLRHNMMVERIPLPTPKDYERIRVKYKPALDFLLE